MDWEEIERKRLAFEHTAVVISDPNIVKVHFRISLFLRRGRIWIWFAWGKRAFYCGCVSDRTTGFAVASGVTAVASVAARKRKEWGKSDTRTYNHLVVSRKQYKSEEKAMWLDIHWKKRRNTLRISFVSARTRSKSLVIKSFNSRRYETKRWKSSSFDLRTNTY